MTPFQQFRLWGRRAPAIERATAAVAAALVLAVLCWLVVPASGHKSPAASVGVSGAQSGASGGGPSSAGVSGTGTLTGAGGGAATSQTATGGAGGSTGGSSGGSAGGSPGGIAGGGASGAGGTSSAPGQTAAGVSGGSTGAQTASRCPSSSDQGVNGNQIKIAIIVLNIVGPAANTTFGIESPSEQQAQYTAMINYVNGTGGVACHKLAPVFFTGDALDQSGLQTLCTNIIAAKPFFVIDYGAYYSYPQIATCYPQAQIPFYSSQILPLQLQQQYYPYMFGKELKEQLYKDTAFALAQKGYLAHIDGLHKLGVLYSDCVAQVPGEAVGYFNQAGVSSSNISKFDVGCNTTTPPSTLQQAIVQFEENHVAYVTEINDQGDVANFTTIAAKQDFKPNYLLPDDGIVPIVTGAQKPDPNNFNGAIAITPDRFGEEFTPGSVPTPATKRCDAIMTAAGQPTTYKSPDGAAGQICDNIWMLAAAIGHAPVLQRNALAAGLQIAGSVAYSFPYGPNSFGRGVNYGGEAWRVDKFSATCACFQVIDPTFHPPF